MKNLRFTVKTVDGGARKFGPAHGKELIFKLLGDDVGVPVTGILIEAVTDDGRTVSLWVSNDRRDTVLAKVRDGVDESIGAEPEELLAEDE